VNGETVNTLPKKERLCGKKSIENLLARGRHGSAGAIRYIFSEGNGEEFNRILVSVPKKLFKRAVKRNLLKRRIRESWRKQKNSLDPGKDILFIYSTKEMLTYQEIYSLVGTVISKISNACQKSADNER